MDALGATASVIAVVQIAQSVGAALKDYYESVRDAREDIQKLYTAVRSLEMVLLSIQKLHRRQDDQLLLNATILGETEGPLKQAQAELEKLVVELKLVPKEQKRQKVLQSLKWPFKKKDIEKVVASIERHKSSLNVALGIENLHISSENFDISADIRSEIRASREDDKRRQIVKWLSKDVPDPSKEHNLARFRHEETTGSWFINGDDLAKWIANPNSFLWLHGGAGAGKSILCSTVIEHLKLHCRNETNSAVVYWYFTFTDKEKQNLSSFLSSLISDICSNRRDTPQALQDAYDQANYGQQRPNNKCLKSMLREVMHGFQNIYIFVDALDECPRLEEQRNSLLDLLRCIAGWKIEALHVMATSRKEIDIEKSLGDLPSVTMHFSAVNVQGDQVNQDIKQYISHRLQGSEFRKWKPELKIDVETAITSKANGMFRLVTLQLDSLSPLRAESKIRAALAELPKTLHEFYDHILDNVKADDKEYACTALQWLAHSARPILLTELAEAVVVQPSKKPYFKEDDRFMNIEDLLEILTAGLITLVHDSDPDSDSEFELGHPHNTTSADSEKESDDNSDTTTDSSPPPQISIVQFAHFSVKEYLTRDLANLRSKHHVSQFAAERQIASSCFAYLMFVGSEQPNVDETMVVRYPLVSYAAEAWSYHMYNLGPSASDENLKLAIDFLRDGSYPWRIWTAIALQHVSSSRLGLAWASNLRRLANGIKIGFPKASMRPITWVSAAGLAMVLDRMLCFQTTDLNSIANDEGASPLYAAILNHHVDMVRVLLEAGLDANENVGKYGNLQGACLSGVEMTVNRLLKSGAQVNTKYGTYGYPLHVAAMRGHTGIVTVLLSNGADINAIGGHWGSALAAAAANASKDLVNLLLQNGADPNIQGGYYGNALQAALLSSRWRNERSEDGEDIVTVLLQAGALVNARGGIFETALQAIAASGDHKVCQILLDHGADVHITGGIWGTALIAAAAGEITRHKSESPLVTMILRKGADPNIQVQTRTLGLTSALQAASRFGKVDNAWHLLRHGANINSFSNPSGSALRIAVSRGDTRMVLMLLEAIGEKLNVEEWRIVMSEAREKYPPFKSIGQQSIAVPQPVLLQRLEKYVEEHKIFDKDRVVVSDPSIPVVH